MPILLSEKIKEIMLAEGMTAISYKNRAF